MSEHLPCGHTTDDLVQGDGESFCGPCEAAAIEAMGMYEDCTCGGVTHHEHTGRVWYPSREPMPEWVRERLRATLPARAGEEAS